MFVKLDHFRQEEYRKNNFTPTFLKILETCSYNHGQFECLKGYELPIILAEKLQREGYTDIEFEEDIITTKIDVKAKKDGIIHTFECKACSFVSLKVINQLRKYKHVYDNVHLFIPLDACVDEDVRRLLNHIGVDIIRADITKKELVDRVKGLVN